jgi:hypothetical protein
MPLLVVTERYLPDGGLPSQILPPAVRRRYRRRLGSGAQVCVIGNLLGRRQRVATAAEQQQIVAGLLGSSGQDGLHGGSSSSSSSRPWKSPSVEDAPPSNTSQAVSPGTGSTAGDSPSLSSSIPLDTLDRLVAEQEQSTALLRQMMAADGAAQAYGSHLIAQTAGWRRLWVQLDQQGHLLPSSSDSPSPGARKVPCVDEYLVHWEGLSASQRSWESRDNL